MKVISRKSMKKSIKKSPRRSMKRSRRRSQIIKSRNKKVKKTAKKKLKKTRSPKNYNEYLDFFKSRVSPIIGSCVDKSHLKKYASRPGPSYSAQDCKDQIRSGNNGMMYISVANKNGVYKWQKL